jgi:hypothetical protein
MRWRRRSDANHVQVCAGLRALGWDVESLNTIGMDAVARKGDIGRVVEIKVPGKAIRLTVLEARLAALLGENYKIITTAEELS